MVTIKIEAAATMKGVFVYDFNNQFTSKNGKSKMFETKENALQWIKEKYPNKAIEDLTNATQNQ